MIIALAQGVKKATQIVSEIYDFDAQNLTYDILCAAWDTPMVPVTRFGIAVTWFPMGDIYAIVTETCTKFYTDPTANPPF